MKSKYEDLVLSVRDKSLIELTKNKLNYVLIRRPKLSEPDGDVDILVKDISEATILLTKLGYMCFSKGKNNAKFIRYDYNLNKWIHLDVQTNVKLKTFWTPDSFTNILLNSKVIENGIYVLVSFHEIIVTILHAGVNKEFYDKEYFERISCIDINELEIYADSYSFLPFNMKHLLKLIDDFIRGEIKESVVINYFKIYFPNKKQKINDLIFRIINRIGSFFSFERGIAILGPDGSGKSTLVNPLSKLQWPPVKKQYMGPSSKDDMNNFLFSLLNYFSKIRERYSKNNPLGFFSRIMWILICYIDFLDRYFRYNWHYGSKGMIIFDRFPCDMFFRKPTFINEFFFLLFFPKPKLVFLCVGDSKTIYERKKELPSPKDVEETILLYKKKLNKYRINFQEIDTVKLNIHKSNRIILKTLIENNFFTR